MAVNAGPYASWGLYKANNLPMAFVRWWLDGTMAIPPATGPGFPITAQSRLTRISVERINRTVVCQPRTKV